MLKMREEKCFLSHSLEVSQLSLYALLILNSGKKNGFSMFSFPISGVSVDRLKNENIIYIYAHPCQYHTTLAIESNSTTTFPRSKSERTTRHNFRLINPNSKSSDRSSQPAPSLPTPRSLSSMCCPARNNGNNNNTKKLYLPNLEYFSLSPCITNSRV